MNTRIHSKIPAPNATNAAKLAIIAWFDDLRDCYGYNQCLGWTILTGAAIPGAWYTVTACSNATLLNSQFAIIIPLSIVRWKCNFLPPVRFTCVNKFSKQIIIRVLKRWRAVMKLYRGLTAMTFYYTGCFNSSTSTFDT